MLIKRITQNKYIVKFLLYSVSMLNFIGVFSTSKDGIKLIYR